jgi:RNA-directed DNA polymerase
MNKPLLTAIAARENLEAAYRWICQRRKDYSANSDIWDFRYHWPQQRTEIGDQLQAGSYHFDVVSLYPIDGEVRAVWSARDALVLRAIAQVLGSALTTDSACLHLKGRGGVPAGLAWAAEERGKNPYFYRSDVKGYYRHIRHGVLWRQLQRQIRDRRLLHILRRYLARVEVCGGVYCQKHQGLNKGDPLAPLMAALYLQPLDRALSKLGPYRRFMDDWLIFANSRKSLRLIRLTA